MSRLSFGRPRQRELTDQAATNGPTTIDRLPTYRNRVIGRRIGNLGAKNGNFGSVASMSPMRGLYRRARTLEDLHAGLAERAIAADGRDPPRQSLP
jgi:hypothetical protein